MTTDPADTIATLVRDMVGRPDKPDERQFLRTIAGTLLHYFHPCELAAMLEDTPDDSGHFDVCLADDLALGIEQPRDRLVFRLHPIAFARGTLLRIEVLGAALAVVHEQGVEVRHLGPHGAATALEIRLQHSGLRRRLAPAPA